MRMPVGSRLTLSTDDMVGLVSSGIMTVEINGVEIAESLAYLLHHIEPGAAPVTLAASSSGYEFQCIVIEDDEWTFGVTKEPDTSDEEV